MRQTLVSLKSNVTHSLLFLIRNHCAQSHQTLCHPMDRSLPGSSVYGIFPGKNTGVACHDFLQGIFLTQGSNLHLMCLLHCRWILYQLSHKGSPICGNKTQLDENNIFLKLWAEATVSINANVMRGERRRRKQGMTVPFSHLGQDW